MVKNYRGRMERMVPLGNAAGACRRPGLAPARTALANVANASVGEPLVPRRRLRSRGATGPTAVAPPLNVQLPTPAASATATPPRLGRDAPQLHPSRRGSRDLALATAADPASLEAAIFKYTQEQEAASSGPVLESRLRTWIEFHQAFYASLCMPGDSLPDPFPLTVDHIHGVAALLKAGGYRSAEEYLSRAKDEHVKRGHHWSDQLARARMRAARSVTRGIGPSKQAATYPLAHIPDLKLGAEPIIDGGPIGPAGSRWRGPSSASERWKRRWPYDRTSVLIVRRRWLVGFYHVLKLTLRH